jgi:7-cyano-7-deazaguanine reductase
MKRRKNPARGDRLLTFRNPAPGRDYEIVHTAPEFTSMCPMTGQPDFATMTVRYVPDRLCVELKSLKLYFHGFRDRGIFYEAVVNRILDDLVAATRPRRMTVSGDFRVRGGISSVVTAWYPAERSETP